MPLHAACASAPGHVALVIDLGDEGGDLEYCVAISEREVTGIDVIELAGDQFGLEYRLGFGGGAVCMLAGVGPEGDDCFASHPDFWGYWRGDGKGDWTWSSSGPGTSSVSAGDTEGWSWGSGMDGSTHPEPPARSFTDVCGPISRDEPESEQESDDPQPEGQPEDPDPDDPADAPPVGEPDESAWDEERAESRVPPVKAARGRAPGRSSSHRVTPSPTTDVLEPAAALSGRPSVDDTPPVGPVAALGATAALGVGAIVINRRRRAHGARARGGQ